MESAFGWIQQIWSLTISLFPHLCLMRADFGGVKYLSGGRTKEIRPGLYWYWPIVTEIEQVAIRRQTVSLEAQALTTKDGHTVSVSAVVIYEINNVTRALVQTQDVVDTISDVAQNSVVESVTTRTFDQLRKDLTKGVRGEIKEQCRKDLRQFGVLVKDAFLADCAYVTAYRVIGDGTILPGE